MKKNYYTVITGEKVILVSYKKEHVAKYHKWMKSVELQKLTGSEPKSLSEEYQHQIEWFNNEKSCTFIVLDKNIYIETKDEVEAMIGDTNLFFIDPEDPSLAEASIMIAEKEARGKKMGWEAILLMLNYGITDLNVKKYIVKIEDDNLPSIELFKKIGFEFTERSEVFKQVTMSIEVDNSFKNWLEKNINFIKLKNCDIRLIGAIVEYKKAQQQAKKDKDKKEKSSKDKNGTKIKESSPEF